MQNKIDPQIICSSIEKLVIAHTFLQKRKKRSAGINGAFMESAASVFSSDSDINMDKTSHSRLVCGVIVWQLFDRSDVAGRFTDDAIVYGR